LQPEAPLAALRRRLGLTIRDVSERTGISTATVSRVERGLYYPRLDEAATLAELFGISVDDIRRYVEEARVMRASAQRPVLTTVRAEHGDPQGAVAQGPA
jgi:transcriptional regulator with XRE-family HTH domain